MSTGKYKRHINKKNKKNKKGLKHEENPITNISVHFNILRLFEFVFAFLKLIP